MENRFSRTEMIIGEEGINILGKSTVAVFGLGGVGSYAVEALARSGIGSLVLVDFDTVSVSNINRQIHAFDDTIGRAKADLMAERVLRINPGAEIKAYGRKYTADNRESFFEKWPDYVVDAIDDMEAKADLIKFCLGKGIPLVSSMGAGNKMDPTLFRVDDISRTSVCPMARWVRTRLRKEGISSGLKVVFSTEPPRKTKTEDVESSGQFRKRVPGSISFVPPVAGMILAGVVVRDLLEIGRSKIH
ncbi:MAG: tRNA threonylcarbamoyladenosine dehydratase [Bacillota bacterium]